MTISSSLTWSVNDKYLDQDGTYRFDSQEVVVAGRPALLITGTMPNERPGWVQHAERLAAVQLSVSNETSAGLLFLRLRDDTAYVYALSWGMGCLAIAPSSFDYGFGLRFAIRRADSEQVRALTSHTLDTTARTNRTSVFGGAALGVFGLEEVGEIVSRLMGRISTIGLTANDSGNKASITIKGADGLNVPLAKTPGSLLKDLRFIDDVVENNDPVEQLAHLENTQPLKSTDSRLPALYEALATGLSPSTARMALCWPSEWDDEQGTVEKYRFSGWKALQGVREDFDLEDVLSELQPLTTDLRLTKLKTVKIQGTDRDDRAASREIPLEKWITFETTHNGSQFVFHRGRWYNIGNVYLDMLQSRLERVFAASSGLNFLSWPKELNDRGESRPIHERRYNQNAAEIEGLHVKRLDDSVSASHLFNQALISFESLQSQQDAREELSKRLLENSGGARTIDTANFRPRSIVLVFADREAAVDSLFTFSQVSLYRLADRLQLFDVELSVASVPYVE